VTVSPVITATRKGLRHPPSIVAVLHQVVLVSIDSTENNAIKGDVIESLSESEYENKTGCNVCSNLRFWTL